MRRPDSLTVAAWTKNLFHGMGVIAAMIVALGFRDLISELREQRLATECRFDVSANVNEVGDQINITTSRIVSAALDDNEALVLQLHERLDNLIEDYEDVAEERSEAVAVCNTEAEANRLQRKES